MMFTNPSISYNAAINVEHGMGRFVDLAGSRFSRLLVVKRVENNNQNKPQWLCKCDCGNETVSSSLDLKTGDKKSCGCFRKDLLRIDLTGNRFGRLVVISKAECRGSSKAQFWLCKCDCGNNHIVSSQHLRKGFVKSCGCLKESDILDPEKYREGFYKNFDFVDGCWNWKGSKSRGYGIFFAEKMIKAHRFSYILHKGQIEKGKIICHTCDNPACVNPEHLYAGTHKQNSQDMIQRGRGRYSKVL